jgi:outer membrane protein assembly factor BamB
MLVHSFSVLVLFIALYSNGFTEDWAQFRGENSKGVAAGNYLLEWDARKNVDWQVDLPGPGSSSPIIVGDRVFVTCYRGYGVDAENPGELKDLKRTLFCLDRKTGETVWERTIDSLHDEDKYSGYITEHGYASSTPVSDGKRVFVSFDKAGVFAFDMEGNQLWNRNVGTQSDPAKWGGGSSPILYKGLVILNASITDRSVVALDQESGNVVWTRKDETFKDSWATPIIVSVDGHDELVFPVPGKMHALNPLTGDELWFAESPMVDSIYGTVVQRDGVVMTMGGRNQRAIAIRCGGKGDVTDTHVKWSTRQQSGIGTPVVVDDRLHWTSQGKAFCASCETGKLIYQEKLAGSATGHTFDYASPIVIGDEMLVIFKNGKASVIAAQADFAFIRDNDLAEEAGRFNGTPAFADGQLIIRSDKRVYSIKLSVKS